MVRVPFQLCRTSGGRPVLKVPRFVPTRGSRCLKLDVRTAVNVVGATVAIAVLAGCASRAPSPALLAEVGKADALLHEGCFECLQDALAIYERVAAAPYAPPDARRAAFDAAVLLTVRARELGLPDRAWLQRATALSVDLVASPGAIDPRSVLEALPLISGEASGFPPDERERRGRQRRALFGPHGQMPAVRDALSSAVASDVATQYVALAIDCEDAQRRKALDFSALRAVHSSPLLQFRIALCAGATDALIALRASDSRWSDTLFFEGRREMTRYPVPDVGKGAELYAQAHTVFPESTAITLALGHGRNALSEYEAALSLFDSVLATSPRHHDAVLGRLLSLSYLSRHNDAIRTASALLDLGIFHQGDAYYWRAWNRYRVHLLPAAWDDVTAALTLMVNTSVHTLAGFIAYAQQRLDTAIDHLGRAYRLDQTNCEAVWTEGLVHVDKQDWTPAAARFEAAVKCFGEAAEQARRDIATAEGAPWADAVKARRIAAARKRIDTSEHRRAQAAYNAAGSHARLGNKPEALAFLEIAATHPLLNEKATALRATVEKRQD